MPRSYSDNFLRSLAEGDPNSLGIRLGRLCVDANIPAAYVAVALECSRMTVYSWFRGGGVSEKKRRVVEAFMALVEEDVRNKNLPCRNVSDAKNYIQSMLGVTV
jgi:hypothetical protein